MQKLGLVLVVYLKNYIKHLDAKKMNREFSLVWQNAKKMNRKCSIGRYMCIEVL